MLWFSGAKTWLILFGSRIYELRVRVFVVLLLILFMLILFGYPRKPQWNGLDNFAVGTCNGLMEIDIWGDYYKYGAMVSRSTDTGWQPGIGEGVRVRTIQVTWWLRFEWMKRKHRIAG